MPVARWTFASAPTEPRSADVALFAFGTGPLTADVPLSLARFGVPSAEDIDSYDVRSVPRAADSRWFDAFRTGSMRAIAEQDLDGEALAALDAADHAHIVRGEFSSPRDLGYLQTAWGLARYLAARGARVVLDAHAIAFTSAATLPPADAPLDVAREVRRIYETASTRADQAHALHTRGLKKFGTPDLVALCTDRDARLVGHALGELADAVALGVDVITPRHRVEVAPNVIWYLVDDEHDLADLLQLNNRAHVLVDGEGRNLVGVMDRLPRGTT